MGTDPLSGVDACPSFRRGGAAYLAARMEAFISLWRQEPGARRFFLALGQGSLGTAAAYIGIMVVAYDRLGSAWAASLVLLADILPAMLLSPVIGAWLDRRDRLRSAVAADSLRAAAFLGMLV